MEGLQEGKYSDRILSVGIRQNDGSRLFRLALLCRVDGRVADLKLLTHQWGFVAYRADIVHCRDAGVTNKEKLLLRRARKGRVAASGGDNE